MFVRFLVALLLLPISVLARSANPSIFLVTDYNQNYTGTAFELNTKHGKVTITNAHVCDNNDMLIALLTNPPRAKILLVNKVYTKHDLCMLTPISSVQALDLADDWIPGEPVVVEGFPLGNHGISYGKIGKLIIGYSDLKYVIYHGATFPGNSGSPVINRYGKVIGVIAIGSQSDYMFGGLVPLEYLKDFIDSN